MVSVEQIVHLHFQDPEMIDNSKQLAVIFGVRNERSIAFSIAQKLHASGCRLAFSYTEDTREDVLAVLEEFGMAGSMTAAVDVRNEQQITDFLTSVSTAQGPVNYLLHAVAYGSPQVMCSSFYGSREKPSRYLDIPFDELVDSFNISAYSLLRICRVAEPLLAPGASILTLTYNASQRVFPGYAGMGLNKAALENIMLYLASYFGSQGIRVNALSAGLVMTSSSGGINGVRKLRKLGKMLAPLGNITAGDVGNAALYYFSPLSAGVTGNIHYIDGGFNIMGVPDDES